MATSVGFFSQNEIADAQRFIGQVKKDKGFLSEEDLNDIPPAVRQRVEEAMLQKDELIGSSVLTYVDFTSYSHLIFLGSWRN
jgi:hypothetical protein